MNRELEARRNAGDGERELGMSHRRRRQVLQRMPSKRELALIPWAGEGPDPLARDAG
jgi:hypothetical protein